MFGSIVRAFEATIDSARVYGVWLQCSVLASPCLDGRSALFSVQNQTVCTVFGCSFYRVLYSISYNVRCWL